MKSFKKKVSKILLSLAMVFAMALTMIPTNVFANETESNVGWTYPEAIIGEVGDTVTLSFSFTDQNGVKAKEYYVGNNFFELAAIGLATTNAASGIMNFKPDENGNLNFSGTLLTANPTITIMLTAFDDRGTTYPFEITYPIANEKKVVSVTDGTPDKSEYAKGDTVTITANAPATGKQFKEWTIISGGVTLADPTSATTTFTMPAEDVKVIATYEDIVTPPTPEKPVITAVVGSTHQIGDGENMRFNCSGKYEDLTEIYVDGELVSPRNYMMTGVVESGSTILTLKTRYLDTLSDGKHTLKLLYKDNVSVETDFTITAKEAPKNDTVIKDTASPKTGDNSVLTVYAFMLLLSGCAVGTVLFRRKKNFNK